MKYLRGSGRDTYKISPHKSYRYLQVFIEEAAAYFHSSFPTATGILFNDYEKNII